MRLLVCCLAAVWAALAAEKPAYDRYGGYTAVERKATGWFRVERIDERWTFFSPEGHPYIALGANLWSSQISKVLINWGLPFFLRFPCSPPLVALAAAFLAFFRSRAALQLQILALRHQLS